MTGRVRRACTVLTERIPVATVAAIALVVFTGAKRWL